MDFINGYGSSGSDSEGGNGAVVSQPAPAVYSSMTINAAPSVAVTHRPQFNLPDGVKTLKTNPRIDTLWSAAGGLQQLLSFLHKLPLRQAVRDAVQQLSVLQRDDRIGAALPAITTRPCTPPRSRWR